MPEARPETLLDIHSTRQALTTGKIRPADLLALAQGAANSRVCRHVYIPASPSQPARTVSDPLSGTAVSFKDLFNVAGQTTKAGSKVLGNAAPANADCPAVARLQFAGATLAGRTNMVEFAFSGVGANHHYGRPVNPADKAVECIPGGSSPGAALSAATGAAWAGLGSDTGGSIRIPAALCGIVGFKSTARLVPALGAVPLSTGLDTVCALTRSVRYAVTVHEVLVAHSVKLLHKPLAVCRFAIAHTLMQDGLDKTVTSAFERSLTVLRSAGAKIEELDLAEISELAAINATGGLSAAESYAWHRRSISRHQAACDPRVAMRILRGAGMTACDYIDLLAARADWIARMEAQLAGFDAVLSPTVPMVAPPIADLLSDDTEFFKVNGLLLRNTAVVNMPDVCGLSLPCHLPDELPVGLMVWHAELHDDAVLSTALQVEAALKQAILNL